MSSEPRKNISKQVRSKQKTLFDWVKRSVGNSSVEEQPVPEKAAVSEVPRTTSSAPRSERELADQIPVPLTLAESPNQPKNLNFLTKTFGNSTKKRSFQPSMV